MVEPLPALNPDGTDMTIEDVKRKYDNNPRFSEVVEELTQWRGVFQTGDFWRRLNSLFAQKEQDQNDINQQVVAQRLDALVRDINFRAKPYRKLL